MEIPETGRCQVGHPHAGHPEKATSSPEKCHVCFRCPLDMFNQAIEGLFRGFTIHGPNHKGGISSKRSKNFDTSSAPAPGLFAAISQPSPRLSRSSFAHLRLASSRPFDPSQGVKMLLTACENETHIDLIVNALKASGRLFSNGAGSVGPLEGRSGSG